MSLGLDFRQADLDLRERFHRGDEETGEAYGRLADSRLKELVLVDTCNRVEAYAVADGLSEQETRRQLAFVCGGAAAADLLDAAVVRLDADAARHALRVACGLESQVLGDIHILGQLRRSYRRAIDEGAAGPVLHRLFDIALQTGKRVKRETALMAGHASVGREAVRLASDRLGSLSGRRCVVVGCGKTGSHAARALAESGAVDLTVVNRTVVRAERLGAELGAAVAPLESLYEQLAAADLVVVATGASRPIVRAAELARARNAAEAREPLLVVDVSMPRNVEREVATLPATDLVDLDALNPGAAAVEKARQASVDEAEAIVAGCVADFRSWRARSADRDAIAPMRETLEEICRREIGFIAEDEVVDQLTTRIVAKFMAGPMTNLRDVGEADEGAAALHDALRQLFDRSYAAHPGGR